MKTSTNNILILLLLFILLTHCNSDDSEQILPEVSTKQILFITNSSAQSGGSITNEVPTTSKGVCWSTSPNPTTENDKTVHLEGTGIQSFISELTNLVESTTYYVRAYATNNSGTTYGEELTFTTDSNPLPANITSVKPLKTCVGLLTTFEIEGTNVPVEFTFEVTDLTDINYPSEKYDIEIGNYGDNIESSDQLRFAQGLAINSTGIKQGVIKDSNGNILFNFEIEFVQEEFESEIVTVDGGTFEMGSTIEQGNPLDTMLLHTVTLSGYSISKYEVTNTQYAEFLNEIGNQAFYNTPPWSDPEIVKVDGVYVVTTGKENHPVNNVNWHGARAYCLYVGGRLPTEAEWEFAAKGGINSNNYVFSGSDTASNIAWHINSPGDYSYPIGLKQSNEIGIHDMSGNVSEWCNDVYYEFYYEDSIENNPQGFLPNGPYINGNETLRRVIRGGNYQTSGDIERELNVRYRSYDFAHTSRYGFRPAFDL